MAGERLYGPFEFRPAVSYQDLLVRANHFGILSGNGEQLGANFRDFLHEQLADKVWPKTQRKNNAWAEVKFRQLREERNDWSLDHVWVDETGQLIGTTALSTYIGFKSNSNLSAFEMHNVVASIVRNGRMVYPLAPMYETVLFWREEEGEIMRALVKEKKVPLETYPSNIGRADVIQMARVRRGVVGRRVLIEAGITLGNIGFLDSIWLAAGRYGLGGFIPRIRFRQSDLLPMGAYISAIDPKEIRRLGGIPLQKKHRNIPVLQISRQDEELDFIAAALVAGRVRDDCPVVLSYTTHRLWLGESPKHGGQDN